MSDLMHELDANLLNELRCWDKLVKEETAGLSCEDMLLGMAFMAAFINYNPRVRATNE